MVYRTERTVDTYSGICNCIDDDIEKFTVEGSEAQRWVRLLKLARFNQVASVPVAIVLLFFVPVGSVAVIGARLYAAKLVKYNYEISGPDTVVFTMKDKEIEKLRKKQEREKRG